MDIMVSVIYHYTCFHVGSKSLYSFTGSAGQAIVSKTAAYLVTDSRYWLQAQDELDHNWHLIEAGAVGSPKDWIEWLVVSAYKYHITSSLS